MNLIKREKQFFSHGTFFQFSFSCLKAVSFQQWKSQLPIVNANLVVNDSRKTSLNQISTDGLKYSFRELRNFFQTSNRRKFLLCLNQELDKKSKTIFSHVTFFQFSFSCLKVVSFQQWKSKLLITKKGLFTQIL